MTLHAGEFMRRFLLHVLPDRFHRIRHYGLFANGHRAQRIELCRKLLDSSEPVKTTKADGGLVVEPVDEPHVCPCCGGRMKVTETFDGTWSNSIRTHHTQPFDSS